MAGRIEVAYESTSQEILNRINDTSGVIVNPTGNKFKPILKGGFMISDEYDRSLEKNLDKMFQTVLNVSSTIFGYQPLGLENHKSVWIAMSSSYGIILFDINTFTVLSYTPIKDADDKMAYTNDTKLSIARDENHFYILLSSATVSRKVVLYVFNNSDLSFVKRVVNTPLTSNYELTNYVLAGMAKSSDGKKYLMFITGKNSTVNHFLCLELTYTSGVLSGIANSQNILTFPSGEYPVGMCQDMSSNHLYALLLNTSAVVIRFYKASFSFASNGAVTITIIDSSTTSSYNLPPLGSQQQPDLPIIAANGVRYSLVILGTGAIHTQIAFLLNHSTMAVHANFYSPTKRNIGVDYESLTIYIHGTEKPTVWNGVAYNLINKYDVQTLSNGNLTISSVNSYRKPVTTPLVVDNTTISTTPKFDWRTIFRQGEIYMTDTDVSANVLFIKQVIGDMAIGYEEVTE